MSATWNSGRLRIISTTRSPRPTPSAWRLAARRAARSAYSAQVQLAATRRRPSSAARPRRAAADGLDERGRHGLAPDLLGQVLARDRARCPHRSDPSHPGCPGQSSRCHDPVAPHEPEVAQSGCCPQLFHRALWKTWRDGANTGSRPSRGDRWGARRRAARSLLRLSSGRLASGTVVSVGARPGLVERPEHRVGVGAERPAGVAHLARRPREPGDRPRHHARRRPRRPPPAPRRAGRRAGRPSCTRARSRRARPRTRRAPRPTGRAPIQSATIASSSSRCSTRPSNVAKRGSSPTPSSVEHPRARPTRPTSRSRPTRRRRTGTCRAGRCTGCRDPSRGWSVAEVRARARQRAHHCSIDSSRLTSIDLTLAGAVAVAQRDHHRERAGERGDLVGERDRREQRRPSGSPLIAANPLIASAIVAKPGRPRVRAVLAEAGDAQHDEAGVARRAGRRARARAARACPGRKFSTSTSAVSTSRRIASRPSSVLRSSTTARLPRPSSFHM